MTSKIPNIKLIDIETSPLTTYTWSPFDDNALKILEFSKIISFASKDLHSEDVLCKAVSDYKGYKKGVLDDEKLVKDLWKILDEADIVVAHHGDKFDIPKINARFVYYGLSAPSFYKSVDTKKVASKYFRFDSNSLNNLAAYLNLGEKAETGGFSLWDRCIQGDKEAWKKMKEYNTHDVILLERVYLTLRPFMENHPNLNLITGAPELVNEHLVCHTCQSTDTQKRGFAFTKTGRKQRYQCNSCGSWSTGKFEKVK